MRSKWKGSFIHCSILKLKKNKINIWSRSSVIPEIFLNKYVFIHNGKDFKKVLVTREKVGFKFGSFSFSKKVGQKIKVKKK